MTRIQRSASRFALLSLMLAPAIVQAQGNASAAATGMGGNYTAVARNFNAVAWNPANLGLPGNSRFSLALMSGSLGMGTGPITLTDLNDYAGIVVPSSVRDAWLQKVTDNGGQNLSGDINITPFALSIGSIAFSATTTVRASGDLPTAMAELLLFGNAGRTGIPQDYTLADLALDMNATTAFGLSYGRRVPLVPIGELAIGFTGKYTLGHGAMSMRDNGSTITSNPLQIMIDAPVVVTDTSESINGTGLGLDVGASWQLGNLRASAVVHDLFNSFAWRTDDLYYIPVRATFDQDTSTSESEDILPLSSASPALQAELRSRIEESKVTPMLALGVAWTGLKRLTIAADLRQRFGDGLELGPKTQIGVGAELRLIPFIPLRAGITTLGDGMRYSGGLGLEFGLVNLQAAAMVMTAEGRSDSGFGLTMSFGGR